MINQSQSFTAIARAAPIGRFEGVRRLFDPLLLVPFALIGVWAVLAAASIAGLGELPIGRRGAVRERPPAEEIRIVAPFAPQPSARSSAAVHGEAGSSPVAAR